MWEGRDVMLILSEAVFNRDLMQPTIASLIFSIASLRVSPSVMHPGRSVHSTTYRPSSSCSIKMENFIIRSYIYHMPGASIKICDREFLVGISSGNRMAFHTPRNPANLFALDMRRWRFREWGRALTVGGEWRYYSSQFFEGNFKKPEV